MEQLYNLDRQQLIDRNAPLPAYQQIANDIIKQISSGNWGVNSKLPSEKNLSQIYGVSRMTLRQAMTQLERDGIIQKFQGKGAFVKENPQKLVQDLVFPSLDLTKPTVKPIISTIISETIILLPAPEVYQNLKIEKDTPVLQLQRLHYHNNRPIGLSTLWFPRDKVVDLSATTLVNNSISKTLFYKYHYDVVSIDNHIKSIKLDALEASLLNSVYDCPGLKINSQYLLADDTPIEYASTVWLSDYTQLHYKVVK